MSENSFTKDKYETTAATNQNNSIGNPSNEKILVKWVGALIITKISANKNKAGTIYFPFTKGTLNLEAGLFFCFSRTRMPPQTKTKANKVPILVNANTTSRLRNRAGIATNRPVRIVENEGVLYLGWRREKIAGSKPSRLILIQILGCPN